MMEEGSRDSMWGRGQSEQNSTGQGLFLSSKFLSLTLPDRLARAGDVVIAAVLLALTLPLFALLCLAIKLDSPGTVIYRLLRLYPDGMWVSFAYHLMYIHSC